MTKIKDIIPILVVLVTYSLAYIVFQTWETNFHKQKIPESLEVQHTVLVSTGFYRGCGLAIFGISSDSVRRVRASVRDGLTSATIPRGQSVEEAPYSAWKETPFTTPIYKEVTSSERWINGACAEVPSELNQKITQALVRSGSFYALRSHAELLVIPEMELVIFSYNR
jgi:hypothetical protein